MATDNSTILGRFYLSGTTDMQQRLDNPTQGNIRKTIKQLFDPMNGDLYNQFVDFMVQRIGYAFARQQRWENPLREFIKQKIYYGATVTETQLNWIKGHSFNVDAEQQFKTRYPDGLQAFHSINSQRQYPISVSKEQMRQAVADEYGLNQLVSAIMQQPMNADEYDMYNMMLDLFKQADHQYGLFRINLTAAPTTEATCKELLQKIQQTAWDLTVPTTLYACVDLPVVVKRDELTLFIRSDAMAATNVQALAALFNLDKAEIPYRTKVVPVNKWPLNDADYAILTTSDFFQVYTNEYSTTSLWDPQGLKTNYWLNDWNIVSFSPFVPIIVFSTAEATTVSTVTMAVTGFTLTAASNTAKAGDQIQLTGELGGTIAPDGTAVELDPDAWTSEVSAVTSSEDSTAVALNSRTRVDRYGVLHIQKTGLVAGNVITVKGSSVYLNPEGETTEEISSVQITIE